MKRSIVVFFITFILMLGSNELFAQQARNLGHRIHHRMHNMRVRIHNKAVEHHNRHVYRHRHHYHHYR